MPLGADSPLLSHSMLVRLRLLGALHSLSSLHPLAARRFRSLNYSGFFLCLSGLATVWLVVRVGAGDVADALALRLLAYACWLYGGWGLLTLLKPGSFERTQLAQLRGLSLPLGLPIAVTLFVKIGRGISLSGLPPLVLALLLSEDGATRTTRLVQLIMSCGYVFLLAISLALVGALSLTFTQRRARLTASIVLLGPFLLDLTGISFPNLITGFVWGLGEIIARGGQ